MLRTDLIRPVSELLVENAGRFGDKVAFRDAQRAVTYAELERRTARLGGHLGALYLGPGDRAAIYLGNSVETIESYLSITRAGAIGVPLKPRVAEAELAYLLADSGARVVITEPNRVDQLRRVMSAERPPVILVTGTGNVPAGTLPFEQLASTDPVVVAPDNLHLDAPSWLLYTSGTTGKPKGVLSTQRNCLWSVAACYVPIPGLSDKDRVVWPLPLFHSLSHIVCVLGVTAEPVNLSEAPLGAFYWVSVSFSAGGLMAEPFGSAGAAGG